MSRPKSPSRRKQLMARYGLGSLVAAVVVSAAVLFFHSGEEQSYRPGEEVAGVTSKLGRNLPENYPRVRFTDVAAEAGLDFRHFPDRRTAQLPEDMGSGAAWGDYDNDGDWDLYLCDIAGPLSENAGQEGAGENRLYRNNGDGTFSDVTQQAGVGHKGIGMAAAWEDFDGDGRLDLVATAYGEITLYRNRGDGAFEDVSETAGLGKFKGFWAGASWADYDRDGDADLYVCGYVAYDFKPEYVGRGSKQYAQVIPFTLNPSSYQPIANLLLRNNGDGTFSDVASAAGVSNEDGRSLSASWADFDLDGLLDLYVANDVSDNGLFRNHGDGTFEDVSHSAWVADYRGAMGLAVGDWDNDSDPDLFVTHWLAQENGFYWNLIRNASGGEASPVLKFTDVADMLGLGQISLNDIGWGTSFFDYDNDGRLDLFTANGSTFQNEADTTKLVAMRDRLYWQESPEKGFFDVSEASGEALSEEHVSRGAAFADYDGDGDVDILVMHHQEAPALLRNDGPGANHWLAVRLDCRGGCVGAVVEIETASGKQRREIGAQSSYLSQNPPEANFGLGGESVVKALTVRFPDGKEQREENVQANQRLVFRR